MPKIEGLNVPLSVESLINPNSDPRLKAWTQELFRIERYSGLEMLHRTNLLTHSMRVKFLSQGLGIAIDKLEDQNILLDFDHFKVVAAADHHDVTEIIIGDYPAPEKRRMSPEQKQTLRRREDQAAIDIYRRYFNPASDEGLKRYLELQEEVREKKTLEAKIVNVADKWDALGEKMHEIACGNDSFIPLVTNSREAFEEFTDYDFWKYIENHPFFRFSQIPDAEELSKLHKIDRDQIDPSNPDFEERVLKIIEEWPICYRSWLELSFVNFWSFAPEFIFPGWYPGLGKKLALSNLKSST